MKTISHSEFEANTSKIIKEVTVGGEIVLVEREKGNNFVVMEEAEYNIMLEALHMALAASADTHPDEQAVSASDTLIKYNRLKQ